MPTQNERQKPTYIDGTSVCESRLSKSVSKISDEQNNNPSKFYVVHWDSGILAFQYTVYYITYCEIYVSCTYISRLYQFMIKIQLQSKWLCPCEPITFLEECHENYLLA